MQEIPMPADDTPFFRQEAELEDGRTWFLTVRWNERAQGFTLALDDESGVRLLSGVRLVCDWPLLRRYSDARLPPGDLWLHDTEGAQKDPTLGELGKRHRLYYVTTADIAEAG